MNERSTVPNHHLTVAEGLARLPGPKGERFVELSGNATCARTAGGMVWCWGGDAPQPVAFPLSSTALDRGNGRCAVGVDGLVTCQRLY
jgi:hypothetical protein